MISAAGIKLFILLKLIPLGGGGGGGVIDTKSYQHPYLQQEHAAQNVQEMFDALVL